MPDAHAVEQGQDRDQSQEDVCVVDLAQLFCAGRGEFGQVELSF